MSRFKSLLLAAILCPAIHFAQIEVKWQQNLSSNIQWQEVTALGNLIVSSGDGLMGVDTETGAVNWSHIAFSNLDRMGYAELPDSPFFTITDGNGFYLIDQFSGNKVFSSKDAGFREVASYSFLYAFDAILVAGTDITGEPIMVSVNMSDGKRKWAINEEFGRIITANDLNSEELLIVTLFNMYKLNANTGDIIWKEANSAEAAQLDEMGAFGALLKSAAEEMVADTEIDLRFYMPEGSDVFYLASQQERTSGFTSSTGSQTVNYATSYNAYRIEDGSRVWPEELEVNGALGQVSFLNNGILVLPDDGNRTKINLFDYNTQEGLWGKKGRGIAIKGGVYDYLHSSDGILLVSRTDNNDYLNYLDPHVGAITFEKPVKVDGTVVGIVPLDHSILYMTTESMNILDHHTGELKWKKSIQTTPELTAEYNGKIYAFDTRSGTLKVVEMATEAVTDLSTAELRFEGREAPKHLEIMEDGILISSDQNVAKFDLNGTLQFQQYFPGPRESGWKRALLYASAVRAAYIGATSYYVSGAMAAASRDIRQDDALAGEVVSQIGHAYGELGDAASSYAGDAFRRANARYKATQSGRDFLFVMSKKDKDIVLLKVSKATGEIGGEINLGKDREPIYAVDDITGQVYYQGDSGLISYQVLQEGHSGTPNPTGKN